MQEETTQKQDFSNYTWFKGTKKEFNAASVSTHEGRVYLGIKGYDKKQNAPGYISAEFDAEELERLVGHIQNLLSSRVEAPMVA